MFLLDVVPVTTENVFFAGIGEHVVDHVSLSLGVDHPAESAAAE